MYGVYDRNKEIREAIRAGERALDSLKEANRQLNSAGNWGLVDIFWRQSHFRFDETHES